MLPRMLKNFNVRVDGRGHIGVCTEVTLPPLSLNTDEFKAAGMDAPVDLDMGMQKLDVQWTLAEYNPETIKLFGLFNADTPIVIYGALQRQGEEAVPFEVRMQGGLKEISRDKLGAGERSNMMLTINCNRYLEIIDGEEVVDIDILNFVRIIGGVDQLEGQRAALGID